MYDSKTYMFEIFFNLFFVDDKLHFKKIKGSILEYLSFDYSSGFAYIYEKNICHWKKHGENRGGVKKPGKNPAMTRPYPKSDPVPVNPCETARGFFLK